MVRRRCIKMLQVVQVRSNSSHDAKYRKKEIGRALKFIMGDDAYK